MNKGYGQYCPLSLAAEVVCQRWSLLVISRLLDGCTRFNQIHRGVPQMSPSLLSKRLKELEEVGLVVSLPRASGRGREYRLTTAGEELEPFVDGLAIWGQRWARDMVEADLDPAFLVWSMHLRMNTDRMPPGQTVLEFDLRGAPQGDRRFWLVHREGAVEMCLKDPELEVDLYVLSEIRRFVEAWRGFRDLRSEIQRGTIRVQGPDHLCEQLPDWLALSALAVYPRLREGTERQLFLARPGAQGSGAS